MPMTSKLCFIGIILSLAAGCTSADFDVRPVMRASGQGSVNDANSILKQGKKEFAANRFGLAIRHFRTALNINPNSIGAMNGLAASYDRLGRFDVSAHFYKTALAQAPTSAATLNNLGYSYYLQNKYEMAWIYLSEAATRDADNNPLISANHRIVGAKLQRKSRTPIRKASRRSMSESRKVLPPHPVPKKKKSVRLVRTGATTYTLYTRLTLDRSQSGALRGSRSRHVLGDQAPAAQAISTEMRVPAGQKPSNDKLVRSAIIVVANGTGRSRMAARTARYLEENGYRVTSLVNADDYEKRVSRIFYKPGQERVARAFSEALLSIPRLTKREDQVGTLYIQLGADLLNFDHQLMRFYKKQAEEAKHVDL